MRDWRQVLPVLILVTALSPSAVFAQPTDPALQQIYDTRADLQAAFDPLTGNAIPGSAAGFLIDLQDWAEQYGWREYPELASFAPTTLPPTSVNTQVLPPITAEAFILIDRQSGIVLAESGASRSWPIASLTKLMTSHLVLTNEVSFTDYQTIRSTDDVGGAKLYVEDGDRYRVEDLFYATLVGSANNAANALARTVDSKPEFIQRMNAEAEAIGLPRTVFADPTGIDVTNVSTASEVARLARVAFGHEEIRRATQTSIRWITSAEGEDKKLTNTNWMLWKPEYDDIFVMSGKTGYLEESGWNLAVSLRPTLTDASREVLLVLFGADSRGESFIDARALAEWTWATHEWSTPVTIAAQE